jgi:hypothetical protein
LWFHLPLKRQQEALRTLERLIAQNLPSPARKEVSHEDT